jgi:serine/threonine-protein kinase RsbW
METYRATLPRGYASVKQARKAVTAFAADCGFQDGMLDDVESAVGEALANAAEHGSGGDKTGFDVSATFDDARLVIEVKDHGHGFDSREALADETPDSSGLRGFGIFLMRQLMDEIAYSDSGSRVQLVKRASFSR